VNTEAVKMMNSKLCATDNVLFTPSTSRELTSLPPPFPRTPFSYTFPHTDSLQRRAASDVMELVCDF
jgi:hypothetical protein